MREIRIHARAGQGAITTAQLLGMAAFAQGRFACAFPHFGAARMGAPMNSFVRIDDKEIHIRSQVYEPDYVLVVDATLMRGFDVFAGLKPEGAVIINEREDMSIPQAPEGTKVYSVPANKIAQEVFGRPLGNTALLGAFAAATGETDLKALNEAISERFAGKVAEGNIEAAKRGFDYIKENYA